MSISGDIIVIGSLYKADPYLHQGRAYVFTRNITTGLWSETHRLSLPNGRSNTLFGKSVIITGTTIFVSAPGGLVNGNSEQGLVVIYNRNETTGLWSETQVRECKKN